MLNNFIYAQTKDLFLNALNAGNILDEAIVFIEDTKEIWNHGHYFGGGSGSNIDPNIILDLQTAVAQLDADKLDSSTAESTYAKKSELPNLSGYLTKATADTLYATISQYNTLNQTVSGIQTELTTKLTADDLDGYAKVSDLPPTVTDATVSGWDYMKKTAADGTYAPKSLVETVSNQATTISGLATKDELSTGLSGKLDSSAVNGFVPTTRKVNGVALSEDITITATDPNAATKTELNNLSTNLANNYVTNSVLSTELDKKQGVISDLATIRSGAAAGATALQSSDLDEINESISDIETALSSKAESSALSNYATTSALSSGLAGKQATLVSGTNIKTVEGQSILGSGDIQITAANVGAYTTGEIDSKITAINNSIAAKADPSSVTAVSNRVTTLEGYFSTSEDSDATINKWKEIVAFLEGVSEGSTVESLLAAKANQSALDTTNTNVANLTTELGKKLDKTGGTISNRAAGQALTIHRSNINYDSMISFSNDTDGLLGRIGISGTYNNQEIAPRFYKADGTTYTLLHSGNVRDYTGKSTIFQYRGRSADIGGVDGALNANVSGSYLIADDYTGAPRRSYGTLIQFQGLESWIAQFALFGGNDQSSEIYYRRSTNGNADGASAWKTIAFTDSNVDSATKLQTARTIWGQSFDGTGNVSGNLTLGNAVSILGTDSGAAVRSIMSISTENSLIIGHGSSAAGIPTYINGSALYFRYGTSRTLGMLINSSGGVTIGASDLAGTSTKLYVDGGIATSGNLLFNHAKGLGFTTSDGKTISIYVDNYNNFHLGYQNVSSVRFNSGNVLIGATDDNGAKLQVNGDIATSGAVTAPTFNGNLNGSASKVNGYSVSVVSSLPSSPDANTIYYVTG